MNQIVTRSEAKPALSAGGSISSIVPRNLDEAFRLSQAIHQAGMSPYGIDTPQKVMIAMLAGLELGMPPMQAVQSVAVINNRPCMWGDGLIGVVRRDPACLYVKEWIEGTGDDRIAYCETKRRGEDEPVVRSFSADDAKRAGLWQTEARVTKQGKNGQYTKDNDSPWYKYPQRMLQMRARAWCLRDVYPDILKGMHSREEVEDYAHAEPVDVQPAMPPLEERLRIARQERPDERQDAHEGFDADFVARETDALTSGAAIEQEPSDQAPAQPTDAGDDTVDQTDGVVADLSPDEGEHEDGAGEAEPPAVDPAPSSNDNRITNLMRECLDKFLQVATADLPVQDRRKNIEFCRNPWKEALPERLEFVRACMQTADQVAKGETPAADARSYLEGLIR